MGKICVRVQKEIIHVNIFFLPSDWIFRSGDWELFSKQDHFDWESDRPNCWRQSFMDFCYFLQYMGSVRVHFQHKRLLINIIKNNKQLFRIVFALRESIKSRRPSKKLPCYIWESAVRILLSSGKLKASVSVLRISDWQKFSQHKIELDFQELSALKPTTFFINNKTSLNQSSCFVFTSRPTQCFSQRCLQCRKINFDGNCWRKVDLNTVPKKICRKSSLLRLEKVVW